MDCFKLQTNTNNLPISELDFGYLCIYHKQHSAVDLYGFTSAESEPFG